MKKVFYQGITASILASSAGIIYFIVYQKSLETHFDKLLNVGSIIGSSPLVRLTANQESLK